MYLIIDAQYRISKTPVLSGYLRTQLKKGNVSVIRLDRLQGMNIDGTWEDLPEWSGTVEDEPLVSVEENKQ